MSRNRAAIEARDAVDTLEGELDDMTTERDKLLERIQALEALIDERDRRIEELESDIEVLKEDK